MLDGWGMVHEGAEDAGDRGGVMGHKGFPMNRSPRFLVWGWEDLVLGCRRNLSGNHLFL